MKQVFIKFAPHLINLIKLFAVRRNRKFKINKIWMNAVAVLRVGSKKSYYKNADKVAIKIYLESSALFLLGRFCALVLLSYFADGRLFGVKIKGGSIDGGISYKIIA